MKVLELKNLYSEDIGLYYRRSYTGLAVLELPIKTVETPLDFTIEVSPMGSKEISVELKGSIDYPLLPVIKGIKELVKTMDREGTLP